VVFLQRWGLNHRLLACVFKAPTEFEGFVCDTYCFFAKTKVGEMFGGFGCKMLKNVALM
jgi:hypothetical protein